MARMINKIISECVKEVLCETKINEHSAEEIPSLLDYLKKAKNYDLKGTFENSVNGEYIIIEDKDGNDVYCCYQCPYSIAEIKRHLKKGSKLYVFWGYGCEEDVYYI